jgi:hypothetical protein
VKSEAEIRKHLNDLRKCLNKPCGCAETGHAFECEIGGAIMQANIELPAWVLNENGDMDRVVEVMAAGARE